MFRLLPDIPSWQFVVEKLADTIPTEPKVIAFGNVILMVPPPNILSTSVIENM